MTVPVSFFSRIIVQLLGLDLLEPKCEPQRQVCKELSDRLQSDVLEWIDLEGEKIPETSREIKDKVIPEMQRLIGNYSTIVSNPDVKHYLSIHVITLWTFNCETIVFSNIHKIAKYPNSQSICR